MYLVATQLNTSFSTFFAVAFACKTGTLDSNAQSPILNTCTTLLDADPHPPIPFSLTFDLPRLTQRQTTVLLSTLQYLPLSFFPYTAHRVHSISNNRWLVFGFIVLVRTCSPGRLERRPINLPALHITNSFSKTSYPLQATPLVTSTSVGVFSR